MSIKKNNPALSKSDNISDVSSNSSDNRHNIGLAYTKKNYLLMLGGFRLVIIGFFIMHGDTDIYSFTRTSLPVLLILLGFALTGVGIMIKDK